MNHKVGHRIILWAVIVMVIFWASFAQALENGLFTVEWKEPHLRVHTKNAPLNRVLQKIAKQTGLNARGIESLRETVTVDFEKVSLYDGLRKILDGKNYVIVSTHRSQGQQPPLSLILLGRSPSMALPSRNDSDAAQSPEQDKVSDTAERLSRLEMSVKENPPDLRESLLAASKDSEPLIRELAYRQLHALGDSEILGILHQDAESSDVDIRRTAISSFADLYQNSYPSDVLEILTKAASDDNIDVRGMAFERLMQLEGGLVAIEEKLADPNPEVRIAAIEIMATQGEELARRSAVSLLQDDDEQVRSRVTNLLSELGN